MDQIKIFIQLTRIDRPIGFMLLFWPCAWGLAFANQFLYDFNLLGYYLSLFFFGSVLMRSAGCVFNDIVDKNIDAKVKRTKTRPLAANKITINTALIYVLVLCSLAFLILIQFNNLTIYLGLFSMLLAFAYPFMKRITYWPQLFLGLTFSWGAVMAWSSMLDNISYEIIVLYIGAIFWTLGYDTIYGLQDITDDEIIGMKSTSIKFKKNVKLFVTICYLSTIVLLSSLILKYNNGIMPIIFLAFFACSLLYQLITFDPKIPKSCLKTFKINNFSGIFIFLSFMILVK